MPQPEIEQAIDHLLAVHASRVPPRPVPDVAVRNYRALLTNGTLQPSELLAIQSVEELDTFEQDLTRRIEQGVRESD